MSKLPFVSVVVPTRNRAKLLPFAIRSVLSQTFNDFEIIVSDNFSSDDTRQVVETFDDSRIRYARSASSLSMGDSWEFALSHAKGEYITFLSDDDAYSKVYLESMLRILDENRADIATSRIAFYYSDRSKEYGKNIDPESLVLLPYDRKFHVFEKQEAIELLLSRFELTTNSVPSPRINFPQLVNTIHHSSIIKKVKDGVGNLFPLVGSDIYTAALFLNAADKYCYVDEPLYLQRTWAGSSTSGDQSMFEKYPEEKQLDFVPLRKLLTPFNYCRNTILRAREDWGAEYHPVNIDWKKYFVTSFYEMKYLEASNVDVSAELREFESVLSERDVELQRRVRNEIAKYSFTKTQLKQAFKNTGLGNIIMRLKNRKVKVLGGFSSIAQCAEGIDESFLSRFSDK
ncbi:MAG: glycosyltransferase family 2 protein [Pyrinomonadaceae bacterium]|nr:glycosyltransferase family 2 protein [Pyrinomonadaceae bacterium]MBP6213375.1 glycosyltransferase family 2 protein [Pyrinomonadaceae bacterium]